MHVPDMFEVQLTSRESDPLCLLREKISTNNHALRRGQNLVPLQIGEKLLDYFTKSETFSSR